MSKERAKRRAERERETAVRAAARAEAQARLERSTARKRALTARLPRGRARPVGVLAERRRNQLNITICLLAAANVLIWVFFGDWETRVAGIVVTLLAAPVLHTMMFRRT